MLFFLLQDSYEGDDTSVSPFFRFAEQDFPALFRCHRLEIRGGRRWRALGTLHEKIMNFASAVCRGLMMRLIQPKIRPRRCDVCCWNLTLPDVPFRLCFF